MKKSILNAFKDIALIQTGLKKIVGIPLDKKMVNVLNKSPRWLLKRNPIYTNEEYADLAYKLYKSLGYKNSINLLEQKYGIVNYEEIHFLFSKVDTSINNHHQEAFLDFLFNEDKHSIMTDVLSGNFIEMFLNFDYFYNRFEYFVEKLGTKMLKNEVNSLLEDRILTQSILYPEISGDIMNDMISSFYHKYEFHDYSPSDIQKQNLKLYHGLLATYKKSSIPYAKIITEDGICCEVLKHNDPRTLVMGYRSGNCFRMNGDASVLFRELLESNHMRLISVSTEERKDIAMMLVIRNGNVLVAQGIEISKKINGNIKKEQIFQACRELLKNLMDQMNQSNDEIVATIIGASNDNVIVSNNPSLPFRVTPILKNSSNYYNGFNYFQYLLDLKENKSLNDIKLFEPLPRYEDAREPIKYRNLRQDKSNYLEIEKHLIAISFWAGNQRTRHEYQLNHKELLTYCNIDWYITLFEDGVIDGACLEIDPRAREEYELILANIKEKIQVKRRHI